MFGGDIASLTKNTLKIPRLGEYLRCNIRCVLNFYEIEYMLDSACLSMELMAKGHHENSI